MMLIDSLLCKNGDDITWLAMSGSGRQWGREIFVSRIFLEQLYCHHHIHGSIRKPAGPEVSTFMGLSGYLICFNPNPWGSQVKTTLKGMGRR
jgi:hypothetical protein